MGAPAQNGWKGWLCVLGGVFIHLTIGTIYLWANITEAVTSHLRKYEPSITYNQTLMVYGVALGVQGVSILLGSLFDLESKVGARYCCLIGGYVLVAGTFLSATAKSLTEIVFYNGAMFGVGIGLCYAAAIACSGRWMPHRKGLVTGIIVAGFGAGSFFFGNLALAIVNPHKISVKAEGSSGDYYDPNSSVPEKVPQMFYTLGLCYFTLITVGSFLLSEPPTLEPHSPAENNDKYHAMEMENHQTRRWDRPLPIDAHGILMDEPKIESRSSFDVGYNAFRSLFHGSSRYQYQPPQEGTLVTRCDQNVSATIEDALFLDDRSSVQGQADDEWMPPSVCHPTDGASLRGSSGRLDTTHGAVLSPSGVVVSSSVSPMLMGVENDTSPLDLIKIPLAWHMASCFVTTAIGGIYLLGTFKVYGQQIFVNSESFLSMLSSSAALFSAIGRVFWGTLSDHIGVLGTLLILSFQLSVIILTYPFSPVFGQAGFAIWTYAIFFVTGGNFALYMPLTMQTFGAKFAGPNYGLIYSCYSFGTFLNIALLAKENVGLVTASRAMGLLTLLGFLNLLLFRSHLRTVVGHVARRH